MLAPGRPDQVFSPDLSNLAELCKEAGAVASTVIFCSDRTVIFYKNPHAVGYQEYDSFDELHIQHQKNACILIAVFPEPVG
jgi:hypothetical protein